MLQEDCSVELANFFMMYIESATHSLKQKQQFWSDLGNFLNVFSTGLQMGASQNQSIDSSEGSSYSGSSSGTTCKRCQGSGKCSSMSGTANKYYCHGFGKCGYCGGNGIVHNLGQAITCTACNGNGKCKYCNGTGKCSDCGGSGKR